MLSCGILASTVEENDERYVLLLKLEIRNQDFEFGYTSHNGMMSIDWKKTPEK